MNYCREIRLRTICFGTATLTLIQRRWQHTLTDRTVNYAHFILSTHTYRVSGVREGRGSEGCLTSLSFLHKRISINHAHKHTYSHKSRAQLPLLLHGSVLLHQDQQPCRQIGVMRRTSCSRPFFAHVMCLGRQTGTWVHRTPSSKPVASRVLLEGGKCPASAVWVIGAGRSACRMNARRHFASCASGLSGTPAQPARMPCIPPPQWSHSTLLHSITPCGDSLE